MGAAHHAAAQEPTGRSHTSPPVTYADRRFASPPHERCSRRSAGQSRSVADAFEVRSAWPLLSARSSLATAGDVAAPSQMEQSVDVSGGRSQLVRSESQPGASLGSSLSNRDARASFARPLRGGGACSAARELTAGRARCSRRTARDDEPLARGPPQEGLWWRLWSFLSDWSDRAGLYAGDV